MCQAEICVKLFTHRTGLRGREGGREEDANPNAVPGLSANIGSDGQQKALGGHPFFMRCNGSKANILFFFQEGMRKTIEESKVQNHFQGHHQCISNRAHLSPKWTTVHPCDVDQIIKAHDDRSHPFYQRFN